MKKGYDLFFSQLEETILKYPNLRMDEFEGRKILKGRLSVIDVNGKHWEDYDVEIHCSNNFPYAFPKLYETSGKIPKIADWHVYEDTLSCCVKIHPEEIIRCKAGITVSDYIREEVLPYLFNQTHRRIKGYYANGEYGHGALGIFEYYADILNTGADIMQTLSLMEYVSFHDRPLRTSQCFCGRKVKYRHCHRAAFEKLKLIGDNVVNGHIAFIKKALNPIT